MAGNVDGMILVVSNPATSLALARLCNARMSEQAMEDLVARLASLGHRRIPHPAVREFEVMRVGVHPFARSKRLSAHC
jgi:hypothetical protein